MASRLKTDHAAYAFAFGRCQVEGGTISLHLAETNGTLVHPSTVWKSIFKSGLYERLAAKCHSCNMERRPSNSLMQETQDLVCKINDSSRCSGLKSLNFKYLVLTEGSLFSKGLESGTMMSVWRQQWCMVEVPYRFGVAFPHIGLSLVKMNGLLIQSIYRGWYCTIPWLHSHFWHQIKYNFSKPN